MVTCMIHECKTLHAILVFLLVSSPAFHHRLPLCYHMVSDSKILAGWHKSTSPQCYVFAPVCWVGAELQWMGDGLELVSGGVCSTWWCHSAFSQLTLHSKCQAGLNVDHSTCSLWGSILNNILLPFTLFTLFVEEAIIVGLSLLKFCWQIKQIKLRWHYGYLIAKMMARLRAKNNSSRKRLNVEPCLTLSLLVCGSKLLLIESITFTCTTFRFSSIHTHSKPTRWLQTTSFFFFLLKVFFSLILTSSFKVLKSFVVNN